MITVLLAITGAFLYRLRGGWLRDLTGSLKWWNGTQGMRTLWSLPTAALIFITFDPTWWVGLVLFVTVFASLALIGHGAHMVFDADYLLKTSKNRTELLTEWWLPRVMGGIPDETWAHSKVTLYNLLGMSFIGLIRNLLLISPIFAFDPVFAIIVTATGLLHGPLYWAGWRTLGGSHGGELLVGALTWGTIASHGF